VLLPAPPLRDAMVTMFMAESPRSPPDRACRRLG
jgi:hypothetical protein